MVARSVLRPNIQVFLSDWLQVFYVVIHLVCAEYLMNQHQSADQLSDRAILRSVGDPGVGHSGCCQSEKVTISRNQHATVTSSSVQVLLV